MYWPTTTAKRLHLSPSGLDPQGARAQLNNGQPDSGAPLTFEQHAVLHISRSLDGDLWAAVTEDTLSVWGVRPAQAIAALVRTPRSLQDYGRNARLHWKADGLGIVVETDQSYLLLYSLHALPQNQAQIYAYSPASGSGARSRKTKELLAPNPSALRAMFASGPGEGVPLGEGKRHTIEINFELVLRIDAGLAASICTDDYLVVSTHSPPAIQCIPWPQQSMATSANGDAQERPITRTSVLKRLNWIVGGEDPDASDTADNDTVGQVHVSSLVYSHEMQLFLWITSDGRVYCSHVQMDSRTSIWRGKCFHGAPSKRRNSSLSSPHLGTFAVDQRAHCAAINARFSLLAVGQEDGIVAIYTVRAFDKAALFLQTFSVRKALRSTASYLRTGPCTSLAWTSDGHALAVGWENGWSVWSTFGKLMGCSLTENWQDSSDKFSDWFMRGARDLFWGPGNTDLFILSNGNGQETFNADMQLFVLPFAKSTVAGQHSPDNTRYASVQLDDIILVYRGSDQPDMSIINPESDVWHQIKVPETYLAVNWPIRYACISSDGRLIAVAGKRGLTHYSTLSGRWKQFQQVSHEQAFCIEGGLQWYQHVLVAACHIPETDEYQIRLYSRDLNLDEQSVLYTEHLNSAVVLTSLFDSSLLVYTADNTLHHFLIAITDTEIRLTLCGSITFEGVVGEPARVRGMSWLVPPSQQRFGDPMDDLMVATIIFLIDGKLVLLRPRRATSSDDEEEVSYDMQILGDRIEFYWTHLQGVGTLENSLWGYDGQGIKLWLDALTIEQAEVVNNGRDDEDEKPEYMTIQESLTIPLDFYPLCVLIEKGIVIGVEPEISLRRSLPFAIFRYTTNTQLFVQHVLRSYLTHGQMKEAVLFASFYRPLIYFAHALEILLHDVLEEEADNMSPSMLQSSEGAGGDNSIVEHADESLSSVDSVPASDNINSHDSSMLTSKDGTISGKTGPEIGAQSDALLPVVVAFLDHFDECLDVVVNCARKTEVARWDYLFSVVGDPRELFEVCLEAGNYKAAGSYLLVLHNWETIEESRAHTVRLLTLARRHGWHNLCKDLLRFTRSLDDDGRSLKAVVQQAGLSKDAGPDGDSRDSESLSQLRNLTLASQSPRSSNGTQAPSFLINPPLSASASESVILEEDESEQEEAEGQQAYPDDRVADETPDTVSADAQNTTDQTRPVVQRSTSLFKSGIDEHIPPPIPSYGLNGRILPATPSPSHSGSGAGFRRESTPMLAANDSSSKDP